MQHLKKEQSKLVLREQWTSTESKTSSSVKQSWMILFLFKNKQKIFRVRNVLTHANQFVYPAERFQRELKKIDLETWD